MGNEEPEEDRTLEEEVRRLGFKKINLKAHLKRRQKLFKLRYFKKEEQD
jgi:hypothetical protein